MRKVWGADIDASGSQPDREFTAEPAKNAKLKRNLEHTWDNRKPGKNQTEWPRQDAPRESSPKDGEFAGSGKGASNSAKASASARRRILDMERNRKSGQPGPRGEAGNQDSLLNPNEVW